MGFADWAIVAAFIIGSVAIGLLNSKKASRGKEDFFLAGRSLGWFAAGTSIVATTFSSDTPQWVAGLSRSQGIAGNWLWWSAAIGQVGAVFLLARYWRRSEAVTEIDFIRLRYGEGPASSTLRVFKALFDGILVNCIIMASVTLAMAKILTTVLGLSGMKIVALPILGEVTASGMILSCLTVLVVLYCAMSGLYGVVYTDVLQFIVAMIGSVLLAVIMYFDASSGEGMLAKLQASPHFTDATLNIVPSFSTWDVTAFTFLMYVGFVWFLNFPTAGYHVQRLLSTRDENQAMRAFLWFNYANYVLRTWPWVVVGVLGLIYYPHASGAESESTYAMAVADFLPAGLKGLMVAAFLAAYMSTISTHLNWGASYLVNDVYQAYINKNASPVQVVVISRVCLVLLAALAAVVATRLTRMIDAYKFLYMLWAGVGTVLVARWYWWRVTPVAELIAIGATALFTWMLYAPVHHLPGAARWIESMGLAIPAQAEAASTFVIHEFLKLIQIEPDAGGMAVFCIRVFVITILTLAIWVPYVLLTSRRPTDAARQFYARLRIASAGWKRVELETRLPMAGGEFRLNLTCWVVTCGSLYGLLIGLGSLLFHQWNAALFWLMVAAACSFLLVRLLKVRNRIGASISVRPAIT